MQTAICMPVSLFCLWLIVMLLIDYSADDWTLATQSKTFSHLESTLSRDIGHLNEYFGSCA